MARDLTKVEYDNYSIICSQIEDDRPMRIMCPVAEHFIKVFRAYEKLRKEEREKP